MLLTLRLLHIGAGVFWAGSILFTAILLEPSVRAAGAAGGAVMRELQARHLTVIMPTMAIITILSGIELMRRLIPGGLAGWVASPGALTFTIGGAAALIAFLFGIAFQLPAMRRMAPAMQRAMSAPEGPERDRANAEVAAIRKRLTFAVRVVATLLAIAVIAMAVARYVR